MEYACLESLCSMTTEIGGLLTVGIYLAHSQDGIKYLCFLSFSAAKFGTHTSGYIDGVIPSLSSS